MMANWKKYLLYTGIIIVGGSLLFILVQTARAKNTGFEIKTLWDWMELFLIPLFLAGGAYYLNRSERDIEHQLAQDRAESENQRAEERAKLEREIAIDRQRGEALQAFLDRMAELLLEKKLRATKNKEVRNVARIRTLTVLRGLDPKRKRMVLLFLYESGLVSINPIVVLEDADLRGADLSYIFLRECCLKGANLNDANLLRADLLNVDLRHAKLENTNMKDSCLAGCNLTYADLDNANLHRAYLRSADFSNASLVNADLSDAVLENANLSNALLQNANLTGTRISDEQLTKAFMTKEEQINAILSKPIDLQEKDN